MTPYDSLYRYVFSDNVFNIPTTISITPKTVMSLTYSNGEDSQTQQKY